MTKIDNEKIIRRKQRYQDMIKSKPNIKNWFSAVRVQNAFDFFISLQNRHTHFLRIQVNRSKREASAEREGRSARKITPAARDLSFALASVGLKYAKNYTCSACYVFIGKSTSGIYQLSRKAYFSQTCENPSLVRKLNVPKCFSSNSWMAKGV